MKGDFSRNTYRPASQYSRVMMQQGRVQIDADWNEQTSILLGYMRALTRDLFGDHGGPEKECGFEITDSPKNGSPAIPEEVDRKSPINGSQELYIMPGRYYVGGLPVELDRVMPLRNQFGFGLAPEENALLTGDWFAYLDVWEEYVSSDQDDHIREIALGGADSCGRAKIMWRVRLARIDTAEGLQNLSPTGRGRIKVWANPAEANDSLCAIDPDARYNGAENQLYRIEIQTASDGKTPPSFKWSRDNGSTTFRVTDIDDCKIRLSHVGRDEATGLHIGDWVELIDDEQIFASGVGQMAQISVVDKQEMFVELETIAALNPPHTDDKKQAKDLHALLRRWDHNGADVTKNGGVIIGWPDKAIELEDGIMVMFEAGEFRPGDYWLIPARVLTGDVEWAGLVEADGFRSPDGPHHFYAPLASRDRGQITDRRCKIGRLPCVQTRTGNLIDSKPSAVKDGRRAAPRAPK